MITKTVSIVNRAGLHTRPAAAIVKLASEFQSDFFINKDGFQINGKSIIGVMTLAAAQGSTLELSFDGPDEEQMADSVCDYFKKALKNYKVVGFATHCAMKIMKTATKHLK